MHTLISYMLSKQVKKLKRFSKSTGDNGGGIYIINKNTVEKLRVTFMPNILIKKKHQKRCTDSFHRVSWYLLQEKFIREELTL